MDERSIRQMLQEVEDDLAAGRWDTANGKLARLAAEAQSSGDQTLAAWVDDARADLAELSTAEEPPERAANGKDPRSSWAWLPILAIFLILWSGGSWATGLLILGALIGSGILLWFTRDWLPLAFRTQMVRRVGVVRRAAVLRGFDVVRRVPDEPGAPGLPRLEVVRGAAEPVVGGDPRWAYSVATTLESVGFRPRGLAVSPDGTRLYVIDSPSPDPYGPSTVSVVDVVTNRHMVRLEVDEELVGMAVSPDGDRLYVVDSTGGTLSVIDTSSFAVLATVEVGEYPRAVAVSPAGTRIYVANAGRDTISVIERASLSATVDDSDVLHSARLDAESYALVRQYLAQREQLPADTRAARARELSEMVAARLQVTPPQTSAAVDAFLEWVAAVYQARQQGAPGTSAAPEPQQVPSTAEPSADTAPRSDGAPKESEQPTATPTDIAPAAAAPTPSTPPPAPAQRASARDEPPPAALVSTASLPAAPELPAIPLTGTESTPMRGEAASEALAEPPPALAPPDQPALPTVGQTASSPEWDVTLTTYGPYEQPADQPTAGRPQSRQVLVEFTARNRQDRTATFTLSDFALEAAVGRRYSPAAQTSYIDRGVPLIQTVPPSSTTENRIVFDLDPDATDLTLVILGLRFHT